MTRRLQAVYTAYIVMRLNADLERFSERCIFALMKLDIDFILIDESEVMNGFRVLMSGAQLDTFVANPVMLFMHNRPSSIFGADDNVILTIGKWYDVRVQGSQLLAKPDFDDEDEFAQKIQNKVQKGYYNGASIWLNPIATSDDQADMLPGQSGPTVTKWSLFEASIVDIPNCQNALAIRDSEGTLLQLSERNHKNDEKVISYLKTFLPKNNTDMDLKEIALKLGLQETATDAEVNSKLTAMSDNATKLAALQTQNQNLQNEIDQLKINSEKLRNEGLVDGAIKAKKVVAGDRDKYVKLAAADFETTKALLDGMKGYESVEGKLGAGNNAQLEWLSKSWDELDKDNKLAILKTNFPDDYKRKFKEKFGVEPK